ncbi:MAG: GH3 auxin-responsive promoter [Flavobacteriales bacterium]|nr:GH3 auxin-responsive promoter [Flavobacteriales bacterium]
MAFLGKIIQKTIDVASSLQSQPIPAEAQTEVLKELLEKAKGTQFGKHYGFEEILKSEDPIKSFKKKVPLHDYDKISKEWWHKTVEGQPDVCWPGEVTYFARSSGTTGSSSKRIPVTDDMLAAIRSTGIAQVLTLSDYDIPADFFEKDTLMLGSSSDLDENGGRLEGEISGISTSNIPFWFQGFYKPGDEISQIDDWDARVQRIAEEAPNWDIGAISGIPSWIELMLKKVIDHHGLKNIHEIWPNLTVYTPGGVAFEPYRESFEKLLDHPLIYIDTYLASEGFLAFQARPETTSMKLRFEEGIFFEFIPFEEEYFDEKGGPLKDAPTLTIDQVETGVDYAIIISTVSGSWRYSIGDTVQFTDVERAEIKITGRTKFFLNVVGSQLSVNKMQAGVAEVEKEFDIVIPEFTVAAVRVEGEYYHKWVFGIEGEDFPSEEKMAEALDEALQNLNKNYSVARGKALEGVEVIAVPVEQFYAFNEHTNKKGGQVKTVRMMDEDDFKEFESFVTQHQA